MSPTGLITWESMWFELGKNRRSTIKNQLRQSDSVLNVDKKWLKNYNDPMNL